MDISKEEVKDAIKKNYSAVALNGTDKEGCSCSPGCCCSNSSVDVKEGALRIGYSEEDIMNSPLEANMGLGCGNPIAIASIRPGETVLDLGCGGGFDCFLARRQVGEMGYVIGVDMTPEMINLAQENALKSGYTNVEFRLGEIEHLPVADVSVDVIISNCVINLSTEKDKVFREAYRVLKPGGRLSVSDIVATAALPEPILQDLRMMAGCVAGAEFVENIRSMMQDTGFFNIKLTPKDNSRDIINSLAPDKNIEDYVASFIIEGIK